MRELEMVKIPAGEFLMGSTPQQVIKLIKRFPEVEKRLLEREIPQHKVYLKAYLIGKYLVTNKEFAQFIRETGYLTTAERLENGFVFNPNFNEVKGANWKHPFGPNSNIKDKDTHPAVQVSWDDAQEYCKWLSVKTNNDCRLPTEAEWEKAARGTDGRIFPWGNNWNPAICNVEYRIKDTTPIGFFSPASDSPYGCADMGGNVFQWTSTTIGVKEPWPAKFTYPYNGLDGREDLNLDSRRISRGGSYSRGEIYCRTAFRFADLPTDRYSAQGFRLATSF